MAEKSISLWRIFAVFAKVGAFTIGGGYAMIPVIQDEMSRRGWISEEEYGKHVQEAIRFLGGHFEEILSDLERAAKNGDLAKPTDHIGESREGMQLSFFQLDDPVLEQIRDEVKSLDINNLTPLEALNKLSEIKRLVGGK